MPDGALYIKKQQNTVYAHSVRSYVYFLYFNCKHDHSAYFFSQNQIQHFKR